jgi:thiol-disulfide isomerase/thioredoxin
MVLSMGVNLVGSKVMPTPADDWEKRFDDTAIRQAEMLRTKRLETQLAQLTDAVVRFRRQGHVGAPQVKSQVGELRARLQQFAREREPDDALVRQTKEVELAVLSEAARRHPSAFETLLQTESEKVQGRPYRLAEQAKISVQRIVNDHLYAVATDEGAAVSLALHALAYPDCESNVALYVTLVDRLVNEGQVVTATALGRQGLQLWGADQGAALRERLREIYAAHRGAVGTPMDFAGPTRQNGELQLAQLRGTPVVVVFWASWCPACRVEIPELNRMHQRYSPDQVRFVGVSLDSSAAQFDEYLRGHEVRWPQLFTARQGQTAWKNPIAKYYGIRSIPATFLVDEKGLIVAAGLHGANRIESAVENYLANSGSVPTSAALAHGS